MNTSLWKSIVLVAILLTGLFGSELKAQENFITNEVVTNGVVTSKIIYKNSGQLQYHMKYDFTYNADGKVSAKEAFKWDGRRDKWVPYFKMTFTYTTENVEVEYAKWNAKDKKYNLSTEKKSYDANDANLPVT